MKKDGVFWVSYSDLMTSLFFVMLVLFIITVGTLKVKQNELMTTIEEQNKILRIKEQFKPLEESGNFNYLPGCNKYVVKDLIGKEIFDPNFSSIKKEYESVALNVGYNLDAFLSELFSKNPDLSYLLVIEGNVANKYDLSIDVNNESGYKLSYERALALYDLWVDNGIDLRQYNTEIMVCGSGFNGLCRDGREENNKRFSIQLIPKVKSLTD